MQRQEQRPAGFLREVELLAQVAEDLRPLPHVRTRVGPSGAAPAITFHEAANEHGEGAWIAEAKVRADVDHSRSTRGEADGELRRVARWKRKKRDVDPRPRAPSTNRARPATEELSKKRAIGIARPKL